MTQDPSYQEQIERSQRQFEAEVAEATDGRIAEALFRRAVRDRAAADAEYTRHVADLTRCHPPR